MNQLETYPQLLQRAEKIGYRISKVVYRGYYASDKLQAMHDNAIECRTRLRLEAETERQGPRNWPTSNSPASWSARPSARKWKRPKRTTQNRLKHLEHEAELNEREADQRQIQDARWREENIAAEVKPAPGQNGTRTREGAA